MSETQNHPLYSTDREKLDRLCAIEIPTSNDFVDLARLIIRYQDFSGAEDLNSDMEKLLKKWRMNRDHINFIIQIFFPIFF